MGYKKKTDGKITKLKTLLSTLKEQQRYVVYRINPGDKRGSRKINDGVIEKCSLMMGMFDGAKAGLELVKFNQENSKAIIRVDNKYIDKLKVCLGTITTVSVDNTKCNVVLDVDYVSGMLNKAVSVMNDG